MRLRRATRLRTLPDDYPDPQYELVSLEYELTRRHPSLRIDVVFVETATPDQQLWVRRRALGRRCRVVWNEATACYHWWRRGRIGEPLGDIGQALAALAREYRLR